MFGCVGSYLAVAVSILACVFSRHVLSEDVPFLPFLFLTLILLWIKTEGEIPSHLLPSRR